jgi:hypothetical protein
MGSPTLAVDIDYGRSAMPADIAGLVAMLIESNTVTGEVIMADGGLNLV